MTDQNEYSNEQGRVQSGSDGSPPWKLIALVIVVAGIVTFFFQNRDETRVHFLWVDGSWPLWGVIGVSVAAGILVDRLFVWQWRRARRRRDDDR
jgi:uncharacterized integral membrane protein